MKRPLRAIRPTPKTQRIVIGQVLKPHGLAGGLVVEPTGQDPTRFLQLSRVWLQGETEPCRVVKSAVTGPGKRVMVWLEGVADHAGAEALRGRSLEVLPEERAPLPEGRYYTDDLVGLCVNDENDLARGKVTSLIPGIAHDLLEVKGTDGQTYLVPFVKAIVQEINLSQGVVRVIALPGLFDPSPPT